MAPKAPERPRLTKKGLPRKKPGPAPKPMMELAKFKNKKPVKRAERSYTRERKIEVILFLLNHKVVDDRQQLRQPRRRIGQPLENIVEVGPDGQLVKYRAPTYAEASEWFKVPVPTINGWWDNRVKILEGTGIELPKVPEALPIPADLFSAPPPLPPYHRRKSPPQRPSAAPEGQPQRPGPSSTPASVRAPAQQHPAPAPVATPGSVPRSQVREIPASAPGFGILQLTTPNVQPPPRAPPPLAPALPIIPPVPPLDLPYSTWTVYPNGLETVPPLINGQVVLPYQPPVPTVPAPGQQPNFNSGHLTQPPAPRSAPQPPPMNGGPRGGKVAIRAPRPPRARPQAKPRPQAQTQPQPQAPVNGAPGRTLSTAIEVVSTPADDDVMQTPPPLFTDDEDEDDDNGGGESNESSTEPSRGESVDTTTTPPAAEPPSSTAAKGTPTLGGGRPLGIDEYVLRAAFKTGPETG
ncbi:hypothetical protein B0H66DRAFT_544976 [Apodospora peruviana]|uniref:Uncharacterized protein n=1 Tax=Apodospora peruviana TaxID=516989 RepID=A0AAE0IT67_9PEZI|nr:hypothetical protein B0H66DRAFT_544976 [Apodospora peruviana]